MMNLKETQMSECFASVLVINTITHIGYGAYGGDTIGSAFAINITNQINPLQSDS